MEGATLSYHVATVKFSLVLGDQEVRIPKTMELEHEGSSVIPGMYQF
jgi:hypothetical protein